MENKMKKSELMEFIKRILEHGSSEKSAAALGELNNILEMQGADTEMTALVKAAMDSMPEAKEAARSENFDEKALRIAINRANDRKYREEMMSRGGRC